MTEWERMLHMMRRGFKEIEFDWEEKINDPPIDREELEKFRATLASWEALPMPKDTPTRRLSPHQSYNTFR